MEQYRLPDGRLPVKFSKRRAAYYENMRGDGLVRYTFSMIKHIQTHRGGPRKTREELSAIAKKRTADRLAERPQHFSMIGRRGGYEKARKMRDGSEDSKDA